MFKVILEPRIGSIVQKHVITCSFELEQDILLFFHLVELSLQHSIWVHWLREYVSCITLPKQHCTIANVIIFFYWVIKISATILQAEVLLLFIVNVLNFSLLSIALRLFSEWEVAVGPIGLLPSESWWHITCIITIFVFL